MDNVDAILSITFVVSAVFTVVTIQQMLITPIQRALPPKLKDPRPLLVYKIMICLFAGSETVYMALCLAEYENEKNLNSNKNTNFDPTIVTFRIIFEMCRYLFLSITLVMFATDTLETQYEMHIDSQLPQWMRVTFLIQTLLFDLTLIISSAASIYSQSSEYWAMQLVHLKFDVLLGSAVAIIALCSIFYQFSKRIRLYMAQLKPNETQTIEEKRELFYLNIGLTERIWHAKCKLYSMIALLVVVVVAEGVYIPYTLVRVTDHDDISRPPWQTYTSPLEFIFQRILFNLILVIFIYWLYDNSCLLLWQYSCCQPCLFKQESIHYAMQQKHSNRYDFAGTNTKGSHRNQQYSSSQKHYRLTIKKVTKAKQRMKHSCILYCLTCKAMHIMCQELCFNCVQLMDICGCMCCLCVCCFDGHHQQRQQRRRSRSRRPSSSAIAGGEAHHSRRGSGVGVSGAHGDGRYAHGPRTYSRRNSNLSVHSGHGNNGVIYQNHHNHHNNNHHRNRSHSGAGCGGGQKLYYYNENGNVENSIDLSRTISTLSPASKNANASAIANATQHIRQHNGSYSGKPYLPRMLDYNHNQYAPASIVDDDNDDIEIELGVLSADRIENQPAHRNKRVSVSRDNRRSILGAIPMLGVGIQVEESLTRSEFYDDLDEIREVDEFEDDDSHIDLQVPQKIVEDDYDDEEYQQRHYFTPFTHRMLQRNNYDTANTNTCVVAMQPMSGSPISELETITSPDALPIIRPQAMPMTMPMPTRKRRSSIESAKSNKSQKSNKSTNSKTSTKSSKSSKKRAFMAAVNGIKLGLKQMTDKHESKDERSEHGMHMYHDRTHDRNNKSCSESDELGHPHSKSAFELAHAPQAQHKSVPVHNKGIMKKLSLSSIIKHTLNPNHNNAKVHAFENNECDTDVDIDGDGDGDGDPEKFPINMTRRHSTLTMERRDSRHSSADNIMRARMTTDDDSNETDEDVLDVDDDDDEDVYGGHAAKNNSGSHSSNATVVLNSVKH